VLVGRARLYGAAIGGAAGVERIPQILRSELDGAVAFLGAATVSDLADGIARRPA
jgi:isopentenyl diphosphate isomerase/L-lactate dehydrogenase-like FMN-dependent dehydrogenase